MGTERIYAGSRKTQFLKIANSWLQSPPPARRFFDSKHLTEHLASAAQSSLTFWSSHNKKSILQLIRIRHPLSAMTQGTLRNKLYQSPFLT